MRNFIISRTKLSKVESIEYIVNIYSLSKDGRIVEDRALSE